MKSYIKYPHKSIKADTNVESHEVMEGKSVIIDDIEIVPWFLYKSYEANSIPNYPTYAYTKFSLYIYTEIMSPQYYTDLFHVMRNTDIGDVINIYINSPGGDMTTLQAFGSVIKETNAKICCYVDGEAGSAAFVLAFMGDDVFLSEFSQLMTHNQHLSVARTDMANIKKYADNSTDIYRKMLEQYCSKILTKKEIDAICDDGREIHLSAKDALERLEKWKTATQKKDIVQTEEDIRENGK